jgi:hypothetical protein
MSYSYAQFLSSPLEPWPDLFCDAMEREGAGWINLLQAAAARIELELE